MNKNKSPGFNGLTVEFYQIFWDILAWDMLETFNTCYDTGVLCKSMNSALIRLIYKKSGSKFDLKNWRPTSLLNVDYKILAKTITNRMKMVMPFVIGEEQTCGVTSRKIHDNLIVLRDIVDYTVWENLEAAIISINQEKAFDRINWKYMFSVLEKMGIPVTMRK